MQVWDFMIDSYTKVQELYKFLLDQDVGNNEQELVTNKFELNMINHISFLLNLHKI